MTNLLSHFTCITLAYCAPPTVGVNVSVEGYSNGVEGSQITYYCQPGLVPSDPIVATCSLGEWNPDPRSLVCKSK